MPDLPTAIVPVTTRVERSLDSAPGLVFDAYAEIDQRVQWTAPADEVVVFESNDFRIGGTDHFVHGPRQNPNTAGTIRYEHIVDRERIVFSRRLANPNDQLLAVSLITWFISPSGPKTMLTITDQTTSVAGSRPIEGARYGYELLLDRLTDHLTNGG